MESNRADNPAPDFWVTAPLRPFRKMAGGVTGGSARGHRHVIVLWEGCLYKRAGASLSEAAPQGSGHNSLRLRSAGFRRSAGGHW
jgi:hypothetical protein